LLLVVEEHIDKKVSEAAVVLLDGMGSCDIMDVVGNEHSDSAADSWSGNSMSLFSPRVVSIGASGIGPL
jgi:hypothetical protein